ncbi:MAG: flagellar basal body L-ring protein FlgH [Gammaproteobacteria bacterium]|nr:flagellar basal body L-ring protein FlgH [Gammaproteobacteria bacterium]
MSDCKLFVQCKTTLLMLLLLTILAGCQSAPKRDPEFASVRPPLPSQAAVSNGAIYQAGFDMRLYEDIKARRVGDILTVRVQENTDGSKSTNTTADKSSTTTISNPTILGANPEFNVPGFVPLNNTQNLSLETNLNSSNEFEGSGSSSQKNQLTGDITVSVVELLPNGNLMVRGEKRLQINNGNEYIRVSGIVRPVDILSDNSVLSTQIADATIVFTGDGQTADVNIMGWLARFFISTITPF